MMLRASATTMSMTAGSGTVKVFRSSGKFCQKRWVSARARSAQRKVQPIRVLIVERQDDGAPDRLPAGHDAVIGAHAAHGAEAGWMAVHQPLGGGDQHDVARRRLAFVLDMSIR